MDSSKLNLVTLTDTQKRLVKQNDSLKKENAIIKRKLQEQVKCSKVLESLLEQVQNQSTLQNHKIKAKL